MPATLQASALLASDPLFQQRVQTAMITAALDVATEQVGSLSAADWQLRHQLAGNILQGTRQGSFSPAGGSNPWLTQFAWAVASNVAIAADVGPPVPIAASTGTTPVTITTAAPHGLATGQWVSVTGHAGNDAANGAWQVTVTDAENFTIPAAGTAAGGATGSVALQPPDGDIQFAVNSVFGSIAGAGGGA